jgi:hypothetical protein
MQAIYPTQRFRTLTKSDTVRQVYVTPTTTGAEKLTDQVGFKALYVVATGDVVVKNDAGTAVTFTAVPAGVVLPVAGEYLMAATSATVIGLF